MLQIPALVFFINDTDSQGSGRGMGGPTTLKVGEALNKIVTLSMHNFLKKLIGYVLWNVTKFT